MPTLIYLIGFMGSGKSTLGRILANVLGFEFVDLDELFEQRFGRPIPEYFAREGEEAFRAAERSLVEESARLQRTIVAAGGGAFLEESNRSLMLTHGLTIYLRLSVSLLMERLRTSRNRPLLYDDAGRTLKDVALRNRIAKLLDERRPFYEQAHVIIDVDERAIGLTVDRIASEIQSAAKRSD